MLSSLFKQYKLPLIATLALVVALVTMCSKKPEVAKEPLNPPPTSPYQSAISGVGIVEPKSELIEIGTDLVGIVRQVLVTVGQEVPAGTPLVGLDPRDIDAKLNSAQASLKVATIQAQQAGYQFDLVWNLPDKRAISKDEFARRQFEAQAAKARVAELMAQIAELNTTRERLLIRAPIAGEILDIQCRPGEAVGGSSAAPLIRMGDTSELHIRVEIDETLSGAFSDKSPAVAIIRGDRTSYPLTFVKIEKYVKPKVNLVSGPQRVDTRVMQVVYRFTHSPKPPVLVGQQVDVFIDRKPQP